MNAKHNLLVFFFAASVGSVWIAEPSDADAADPIPADDFVTAGDRDHWAFKRLERPSFATSHEIPLGAGAVDFFIQRSLAEKGLHLAPPAERSTLLRRIYLDLIGIPPTLEQQDAFLSDTRPDAFLRVADQLLSSPQFGQRWGRHWLDVVGYADTVGFDHQPMHILAAEGKWRYRDYVIDAFNEDLSYTKYVQQQLAGDELVEWKTAVEYTPNIVRHLVATGFLRTARDQTHEQVGVITPNFYEVLHDTTEIITSSLLGMTVKCARCHDHKFDAFSQLDYYRIQACLMPSYNPSAWRAVFPHQGEDGKHFGDRSLPDVSGKRRAEIQRHNARLNRSITELNEARNNARETVRQRISVKKLEALPTPIRLDLEQALALDKKKRNPIQVYLADKLGPVVAVKDEEIDLGLNDREKQQMVEIDHQLGQFKRQKQSWGKIQALYEVGKVPTTFLLKRGQFEFPGRPVQPGFLSVLCDSSAEAVMSVPRAPNESSGRRLGLAQWLTDPQSRASSLLARVMVNRIWQHLFGRGIVETADEFGVQGSPPTHPELLEWLCLEFQRNNWRVKPVIRILVTSNVYRQSSQVAANGLPQAEQVDPDNKLYWRMPLRRLESEIIRDSLLSISNQIDLSIGGPPVRLKSQADGRIMVDHDRLEQPADARKRSVYLLTRRGFPLTLLDVFDQPQIETTCSRRQVNVVPQQSLTMLNDQFVYERAQQVAREISNSGVKHDRDQITEVYRKVLCRFPDSHELELCQEMMTSIQTKAHVSAATELTEICHALFNTSEFLYRE